MRFDPVDKAVRQLLPTYPLSNQPLFSYSGGEQRLPTCHNSQSWFAFSSKSTYSLQDNMPICKSVPGGTWPSQFGPHRGKLFLCLEEGRKEGMLHTIQNVVEGNTTGSYGH